VVTVTARDTPVAFEFVAQIESSQQVDIHSRVNGFLIQRAYTEGALVRRGDVLFRIDPKPLRVQLDQALAVLQKNQAVLSNAQANFNRVRPLVQQHALSQKELDDATGTQQSAAAAVAQSEAQVDQARLNLSYATITSPINGITGAATQADGTYISEQNSLLTTVAALSPMWVNFSMSENQFQTLREEVRRGELRVPPGQNYTVQVEFVDGSIFPYTGNVTFLDPYYNPNTGTFLVRASVQNPAGVLRPYQFVRARVAGAVRPNAILVPQRAVQQGSEGAFVWVVEQDQTVDERPVMVGDWHGDAWFITQGLRSGEQVVVDGVQRLAPKMHVTLAPAAQAEHAGP